MNGAGGRTPRPRPGGRVQLTEELAALSGRTTRELSETWEKLLGTAPPGRLSRDLLMRVIADKLQEAALGGLPPAAKRRLAALARRDTESRAALGASIIRLKPGSKLVREWRGTTHTVLVLADGFEHQGTRYASLTQIAREVTGAHWSGPRFFGLTTPRRLPAGAGPRDGA